MNTSMQILDSHRPILIGGSSTQSDAITAIGQENGAKSTGSFQDILQQMVSTEGSSLVESMGIMTSALTPPSTPGITPPSIPGITPPITPGIMPPNTPGITPTNLYAEIAPPCTPPGIVPPGTPPGITPPSTPGNTPPIMSTDNNPLCIIANADPSRVFTEQNPVSISQNKKYSHNELAFNALPSEDVFNSSNIDLNSSSSYNNTAFDMLFESLKYQSVLGNKNEGFKFFG